MKRHRSRSRSRSPDRYRHHKYDRNRDRDRDRDRDRKRRRLDKPPSTSSKYNKRDYNNNNNNAKDDLKRLIASRSQSVLRSQSVARSNSIRRSFNKQTNNSSNSNDFQRPKPKFLNKAQREQIALQKLTEKRALERKKINIARKSREKFFRKVREQHNDNDYIMKDKHNNNNKNKNKNKKMDKNNKSDNNNSSFSELQLIKDQYLGKKQRKKLIVPPSQKFKFNFDWETSEDTSEDLNKLYYNKASISFLFGRGYMAGTDRNEQKKKNELIWKNIQKVNKLKNNNISFNDGGLYGNTNSFQNRQNYLMKKKKRELKEKAKKEKEYRDSRNWREKTLSEMTERDWRILREEFRISTKFGGRLPNPIRYWNESNLPKSILRAITEIAQYSEPYKIQRMAIPVGLTNRDCVGIAETGSGKTAAFVLPMLVYVLTQPPMNINNFEDGPYALVLAPTRELAKQIEAETNKFATFINISAITIIGGINEDKQSTLLREGVEVIIATPGRLLDCIDNRILVLNQCNYVVLDEADRMIDMGFEPQVNAIFDKMPTSNLRPLDDDGGDDDLDAAAADDIIKTYRQTFMFSATMPPAVERLTRKYLRNPVYITIGDPNSTANEHVKQNVLWVLDKNKRKKLQSLLPLMESPIMIFVNMKKTADTLSKYLRTQQFSCISLHGGKSQDNREYALNQFKKQEYDILVCTNVAGRGIDVENVQHVINYDMPNEIRDYCHRIGRTGRAGNIGVATSFLTKNDVEIMYDLKKMLLKTGNSCPQELMQHEASLRNPNAKFEPKTTKQILAKVKPV